MNLEEKINADIKTAMLAREKDKLEALRAIKSAVLLAKTAGGVASEINEADENKLLQKLVKQRKDAAEIYISQARQDMANAELFQAAIIEKYLPQQLSEEDIKIELNKIINETGATSAKDMGKVMGLATQRLAGKADGKVISQLVKTLLD
jgi:uncharacterized protein YqeY